MKKILTLALFATVVMLIPVSALGHPGGVVTDDPLEHVDHVPWLTGTGISSVEPSTNQDGSVASDERDPELIGALELQSSGAEVHGDVMGFRDLAFVGKWRGECPGTGVDIIDISDPEQPVKVSDTLDHADTSMEDMQAIRVGERFVLATGLQDCGNDPAPEAGVTGLELYDITEPDDPQLLSFFETGAGGVHELDVTSHPSGKVLALLAVPNLEAETSDDNGLNGTGDLLVVDITDPANPVQLSEWGVLDEPSLGAEFYLSARQGGDARTLLHSARANADGTIAYLSYWDAGVLILDLTDPANPALLGRTAVPRGKRGQRSLG